ncbi:MAG: amino acid permease [Gammaproteobacteria bacterium]|nr:amino acid permease [Gammaproteobacteria bacterium]
MRVLSVVHLCFMLPSLGLLMLFALQGVGETLTMRGATVSGESFELPSAGGWLAAYFLIVYTTYGIETAAAFTADSRNPKATLNCLLAAAVLLPVVMVGGSLFLAFAGPTSYIDPSPGAVLETAGASLWGVFTPIGVTFMVASSMVLACATAVAVAPRVLWQLSRDGLLTPFLGILDRDGVPRRAVALAMLLALGHLWMDVEDMLLLGGATWVGFWCLMHLGLWGRRHDPRVLWPRLALGLAFIEALCLVVGGYLLGGSLVAIGLAMPLGLAFLDTASRNLRGWRPQRQPLSARRLAGDQQGTEIALTVGLILIIVSAGWWVGRLVGPDVTVEAGRLSIILLLITAFVGIAWAAWTHLRRLEQLQQARDDFHDVIVGAPDAVLVVDSEGRIRLANPAAERLLQDAENSLLGLQLKALVPGLEGTPAEWNRFQEYELTEGSAPRTVELAARSVPSSVHGEFTVTLRDLTDRKVTENALRASERHLQAALEASRSIVWDLNTVSGQLRRQGGPFDLLGYPIEATRTPINHWQSVIHRDDLAEVLRRMEAHFDGSVPVYESEHRVRTRAGKWLWILERGRAIARDEQGRATRMIGSTTDISQIKELELQLAQAQKMEAIGHLAGGVAHDFNNVLTAILTTAELLIDDERLQADQREDLIEIREAAQRAAQITSQLLAFGRRQQLRPKPVNLNEAVTSVTTLLRRLIGEHIRLEMAVSAEPAIVRADPVQLEQAIINLAVNARDAMPDGGSLTIAVESREVTSETTAGGERIQPGPAWSVVVTDNGAGMDAATRSRLFEPFFTTKGVGEGAGLGLAMVYGFVRQSGGIVLVESQPGEGTRFELLLPRATTEAVNEEATIAATGGPPGSESILLVEDEAAVRKLIQRALEGQGYQIEVAANGREALAILDSQPPSRFQLVISDLVMPEVGGRELAERLRQTHPYLKILFISVYPNDSAASGESSPHATVSAEALRARNAAGRSPADTRRLKACFSPAPAPESHRLRPGPPARPAWARDQREEPPPAPGQGVAAASRPPSPLPECPTAPRV